MIWEEYSKIRENLDEYIEKAANDDDEVILLRRGKEPDVVLMSRNQYTILQTKLRSLQRVQKLLDDFGEYLDERGEKIRKTKAVSPKKQNVEKRIGAGIGLFDIPDDFFDDDFEPDDNFEPDKEEDQAVSGKAQAFRVAV